MVCFFALKKEENVLVSGYETDERGSLGERTERRRWREERGEGVAATSFFEESTAERTKKRSCNRHEVITRGFAAECRRGREERGGEGEK